MCNFLKVFSFYFLKDAMLLKKEIILFYLLIVFSAAVIVAADPAPTPTPVKGKTVKCCKAPKAKKADLTTPPLYYITEALLRLNA